MFDDFISGLNRGEELDADAIRSALALLVDPAIEALPKADFLTALARKGETAQEIAGFAQGLRELSRPVPLASSARVKPILDVCGTGGDRLNTFNISTTVALVCAAAGVTVAKHGNRAITSQSGSADVLQALGIPVELEPEQVAEQLERHGFAFLFAPKFHPAFQHIGPARKLCAAREQRTIFNFLGPLLNPARPSAQLLGVSRPELVVPMAQTLQSLGLHRAMVVSGTVPGPAYLDELSTLGDNTVAEFYQDRGFTTSQGPVIDAPLQPATLADLAGGDRFANAAIIETLFQGKDRGPRLEAVLLNAGAALFVAGAARSITEGWDAAEQVILGGRALAKLNALRTAR
jgi:anthranilate phosphoribosyltransferase